MSILSGLTDDLGDALVAVAAEVQRAGANWPMWASAHEGFAVLHEEFDELKAHVWTNQKRRDIQAMRLEAIQVAAVAVRFAIDICNEERGASERHQSKGVNRLPRRRGSARVW